MSAGYTENDIQESAGKLLHDELGWQVVFAYNKEVLGEKGTLGRKSYEEVVLWRYFRKALRRLNPWINDEQTAQAQRIFSDHLASNTALSVTVFPLPQGAGTAAQKLKERLLSTLQSPITTSFLQSRR